MNKQIKLFFILFVSALFVGFSACSDDDDDDYAKTIAGTYKGSVSFLGQEPSDAEIALTRVEDNKVKLTMNQNLLGQQIDIETVSDVTLKDGKYTINATAVHPMGETSLPIAVTGTVDKSKKMNLVIVVGQGIPAGVMPPFPLDVTFTGERK